MLGELSSPALPIESSCSIEAALKSFFDCLEDLLSFPSGGVAVLSSRACKQLDFLSVVLYLDT